MTTLKTRTAYLIRSGEMDGINVSNRHRARSGVKSALKAAKRLGFPNAYAAKVIVKLLPGETLRGDK